MTVHDGTEKEILKFLSRHRFIVNKRKIVRNTEWSWRDFRGMMYYDFYEGFTQQQCFSGMNSIFDNENDLKQYFAIELQNN